VPSCQTPRVGAELLRSSLPWRDPEQVVLSPLVRGDVVWHDAGADAVSGTSTVGWGPATTASVTDGSLAAAWQRLHDEVPPPAGDDARHDDPTGWAGWVGHGAGRWLLGLPDRPHDGPPDLALLRLDHVFVFDHAERTVEAVSVGDPAWHDGLRAAWPAVPADAVAPAPPRPRPDAARWDVDGETYEDLVRRCQDAIRDGDAYQLCLTTTVTVPGATDPVEAYRRLRRSSPAPHAWFVRVGGHALLCASPESALEVGADGVVTSSPIKGTRPRSADPDDDAAAAAELVASEKERAENLMIVDLVRNDLSRVCRLGTVAVTELLALHRYAHVHQLVSTVRGQLRPGATAVDALAACFPAGSMTGAPKLRAAQLLDGWEARPRGVYAGVVGRLGLDGSASLAMVIRSLVVSPDRTTLGVGGGVTSHSVPADEWQEARHKAAAPLAVLGCR